MNFLRSTLLSLSFLLITSTVIAETTRATWSGFRGPAVANFDLPDAFGLEVDWSRELGSGYSSMAIAGDRLITAYTSGEDDLLGAFDLNTGDTVWTLRIADKYAGHDGSDDGPLSTPTIAGDSVYILGARGQLIAASLTDGSEQWRVQLDENNSSVPFYGYTASPVVTEDLVILSTGGEGRAITAFDRGTGEQRWSQGSDTITYQTPIRVDLGDRSQIVAVTDRWALGLDPSSGDELWSFQHSEGETRNGSAHPTLIGENQILLNLQNESVLLEIGGTAGKFEATEVWRSRIFANSLVLPVLHDGNLYGFTGRILTSASAATGEINWRSRAASAFNLSLVDGHLVILDRSGELIVAAANPDEYVEVARVQALEIGDYADPAYAAGHFYIRNLSHLARVAIGEPGSAEAETADVDPLIHSGAVGKLAARLAELPKDARQAEVDTFFEKVDALPIVEGNLATIVSRDAKEDVAVAGNIFGWTGDAHVLHHVEGTDLFYRAFELDPKGSYSYTLAIDFEQPAPDAANPLSFGTGFVQSELRMAEFRANPALAEPGDDAPRGQMDTFQFKSEKLDNFREIRVWRPADYDAAAEEPYPLLVVHHGDQADDVGLLDNVLDNLVGASVEPLVAVLIPRRSGAEFNGDQAGDYLEFLTTELLPHIEHHYHVSTDTNRRGVTGVGSAGVISLHAALAHPGLFGKVATQSFYLGDANRDAYWELVDSTEATFDTLWIESGPNDYDIPANGIDAKKSNAALLERLDARGFDVHHSVVHGAAGWAGWRAQSDLILEAMFPAADDQG